MSLLGFYILLILFFREEGFGEVEDTTHVGGQRGQQSGSVDELYPGEHGVPGVAGEVEGGSGVVHLEGVRARLHLARRRHREPLQVDHAVRLRALRKCWRNSYNHVVHVTRFTNISLRRVC